ncbi:hypothetical protein BV22DRAFT_1052822 [Leucogyrophana mollusca]|uniref:Uncharacterized protein n=1 Tax=Leucogyrophana mollusca TaxID=85980 RepID=A0ACB8AWK2_9AGAM|nr:hypothetical protein BV22DRAFT_1052822 [Leucogyrophana mollusca]
MTRRCSPTHTTETSIPNSHGTPGHKPRKFEWRHDIGDVNEIPWHTDKFNGAEKNVNQVDYGKTSESKDGVTECRKERQRISITNIDPAPQTPTSNHKAVLVGLASKRVDRWRPARQTCAVKWQGKHRAVRGKEIEVDSGNMAARTTTIHKMHR